MDMPRRLDSRPAGPGDHGAAPQGGPDALERVLSVVVDDLALLGERCDVETHLRVTTAAVLDADDLAVGFGELVAAGAEPGLQRATEWQIEAAGSTARGRVACHRGVRPAVAGVPALGGVEPALARHHPLTPQAEL